MTDKANTLMRTLIRKESESLTERARRLTSDSPSSAVYAARRILDVASMPLGDYYADVMSDDARGVQGAAMLADRMDKARRTLGRTIGQEAARDDVVPRQLPPAPSFCVTTTVAQAARMLRDMLDICPSWLRRHPRATCDSRDRLIAAAEWLTEPLQRVAVDFANDETIREAIQRLAQGPDDTEPTKRTHVPVPRTDIPRVPFDDRMREASRKARNGVAAYGPWSSVGEMSGGFSALRIADGYAMLLDGDASTSRGQVVAVAHRLSVNIESNLGFMLHEQMVCSDPLARESKGAPDLSDRVDHDLDAHVLLFVRPMAALSDRGLA